jgi:hypothetical protein
MKKVLLVLCILCILVLPLPTLALISTNTTSIKDPEFANKNYQNILVVAAISDLEFKQKIENQLCEKLKEKGIESISSIGVIPPIRKYSDEEIIKILNENNIQGILVLKISDYNADSIYIPSNSETTQGRIYSIGNSINYTSTTKTNPGYSLKTLKSSFRFDLIDAESGKIAWAAITKTKASGWMFANDTFLISSTTSKVIKKLVEDQIIIESKE